MKICYVNPTFLVRRPIANLIGLLGNEHKIGLFIPKKPFQKVDKNWHSNQSLRKARVYSYSAINIPFLDFEWPIPITPMFLINLFRIFLRYKTIHMWTYFYINSWFVLLFKLLFGRKLIMSCDTFPAYSFSSGKLVDTFFKIYTALFGWLLFLIPNKVHLYGQSLVQYSRKIGLRKKKIVVISTGINLDKFQGPGKNIRSGLGLSKDDFILVYAGLMVPRKGIDTMLKAVKKVNNKQIKLLLIGEGPSKEIYQAMAKKLGIDDQVIFTTWRQDIPDVFKSSNVLFLPSRGEGLPGVVMEAMACGLPVVTSSVGCVTDLIMNGKSGYICKVGDINCFIKRITDLRNKKKFNEIKKEAQKNISKFDWKILIEKYIWLYKK